MAKAKNNTQITTLKAIKENQAIEKEYARQLKRLSLTINKSVAYWSLARFNQAYNKNLSKQLTFEFNYLLDFWNDKVKLIAEKLANKQALSVEKYVNANLAAQNEKFKTMTKPKKVKQEINAIFERNLALIKTIPSEIIERYRSTFLNNINNFDREALTKQFKTIQGISKRKAELIARDQTQKAVSQYTQAKSQSLGFEYYKWVTSQDERVSTGKGGHIHLNGKIYKYNEPTAIIDSYGNIGTCGTRVNCRCVSVSVIIEPGQEVKRIKDNKIGDYFVIIDKN